MVHNFFAELKRRNVYKVAVAYAVVGWLIAQIATQIFPFLEIPNWVVRLVIVLGIKCNTKISEPTGLDFSSPTNPKSPWSLGGSNP